MPRCTHAFHRAGSHGVAGAGGRMGCLGSRERGMPTAPRDIWRRLPAALQEQIIDELTRVFQEVIHESLRAHHDAALEPPRAGVCAAVEPPPGLDEPREAAAAVCPAAAGAGAGVAARAD